MSPPDTEQQALGSSPDIPRDEAGPVFCEPWEAQAFAITVALYEAGKFTWPEWAAALSAELKSAGPGQRGEDYYSHWLTALEKLSASKGLTDAVELGDRKDAWDRAARATPHGEPIVLEKFHRRVD